MKRLGILIIAFFLVSGHVAGYEAFSRDDFGRHDSAAVAWLEGDEIFIAVANPSSTRQRITIEPMRDSRRGSDAFSSFTINVPGRTVVLESVRVSTSGRSWRDDHPVHDAHPRWGTQPGDVEEVTYVGIDGGRLGRYLVPVQIMDPALPVQRYVVFSDDLIEFELDLDGVMAGEPLHRLVVGDYRVLGTRLTGAVRVVSVEGGFRLNESRLEVTLGKPLASLRFWAPEIRESRVLTFDLTHVDARDRRQTYAGPMILIVGSSHSFQDATRGGSSRTVR